MQAPQLSGRRFTDTHFGVRDLHDKLIFPSNVAGSVTRADPNPRQLPTGKPRQKVCVTTTILSQDSPEFFCAQSIDIVCNISPHSLFFRVVRAEESSVSSSYFVCMSYVK